MSLTSEYSGVIVNQNATPTAALSAPSWYYQSFKLPINFRYGSEHPYRFPSLSGFQVLVKIPTGKAASASLEYVFQHHQFGVGWHTVAEGTATAAHTDGEKVWMDVFFPEPVQMNEELANVQWRIGVKAKSFVDEFWSVSPALPNLELWAETTKQTASLNFRLLAMVADSGTDFLGNPFRSLVVTSDLENTSTTNGLKSGYWRSSPQPSKFAVVSNYFDVRKDPGDVLGSINLITNPSFEYDKAGLAPSGWTEFISEGGVEGSVKVSEVWSDKGNRSLKLKSGNLTNPDPEKLESDRFGMWGAKMEIPLKVTHGDRYELHAKVNVLKLPEGGKVNIRVNWMDESHTSTGGNRGAGASSLGIQEIGFTLGGPPPNMETKIGYARIDICAEKAIGEYEWYVDSICFTKNRTEKTYFDGDTGTNIWLGTPGHSASMEVKPSDPEDSVVIDGVMLDPQTPNVAFSVYYTQDGDANEHTTTEEWEKKLWTRVPKTFVATQRQTYLFPKPVVAKFVKIEYSHLQAQSYNPGDFQRPITYKKYPKWVANYFLSQIKLPNFVANRVGVVYDALQFAYEYYLDDLHQRLEPELPHTNESAEMINKLFSQSDAAGLVDPTTLEQINLTMKVFTEHPALQADQSTLLGKQALHAAELQRPYPIEPQPTQQAQELLNVSTTKREDIVFEESIPVMYFFLPCRHAYRELSAPLDNNRAYFVGVNEIAFIRQSYTTEFDNELYAETGIDSENLAVNDFVINEDGIWSTF